MANKKGSEILTDNLLSTIVAIIVVALIFIPLGVKLYNFIASQDERNAKQFLDSLTAKIDDLRLPEDCANIENSKLPEGCKVKNTFALIGIKEKVLVAWQAGNVNRPEKCFFKNCICICDKPDTNTCQEKGYCKLVEQNISLLASYNYGYTELGPPPKGDPDRKPIYVSKTSSGITHCAYLSNKLSAFTVVRSPALIEIQYGHDSLMSEFPSKNINDCSKSS